MISESKDIFEIITNLIGFIGGISKVLIFAVPYIVRIICLIFERCHHYRQRQQMQIVDREHRCLLNRIKFLYQYLVQKLLHINLFSNRKKAIENQEDIRRQSLASKIYIVLLALALIILGFYSSLTYTASIQEINISTVDDYVKLRKKYDNYDSVSKFECPCTTLSVTHSSYISQLKPQFHEVCSSYIVSDEWLQTIFENSIIFDNSLTDAYALKGTDYGHYQALKILCNMVKGAVEDTRQSFLNSIQITSHIVDQNQFEQDTITKIQHFQQNLPTNFLRLFKLIRGLNQGNGFISAYMTNWHAFIVFDFTNRFNILSYNPRYYDQCNCATTATCHQLINDSIPGYMAGCVPIEALLQSTLECHYNLSCIQLLHSYIIGKFHFNL